MKISKLFHWLYFSVMMLPIFIIPIFAIFSRNENYNSNIELQVQENRIVNFNQQISYLNYPSSSINGITFTNNNDGTWTLSGIANGNVSKNIATLSKDRVNNHKVYWGLSFNSISGVVLTEGYTGVFQSSYGITQIGTLNNNFSCFLYVNNGTDLSTPVTITPMFIDLTYMFGSGYEPNVQQFQSWYNEPYYPYTLDKVEFLKNYSSITYNDSDVGSQYLYTMYNGVDKYFNYDKVFNFGYLYDWLQVTFFDGNATLGFFIFWHLLLYWLLTSLLWLLFDVLMYVPNLVHRWLDKASLS